LLIAEHKIPQLKDCHQTENQTKSINDEKRKGQLYQGLSDSKLRQVFADAHTVCQFDGVARLSSHMQNINPT
jgi:hypothetical protein